MPRAQVLRETELLQGPARDSTPWHQVVYALSGSILYVDPQSPNIDGMVQVQATGAGNFQMNVIDANIYQAQQQAQRQSLSRQGKTLQVPGFGVITSQRRNAIIAAGRTFWASAADLQVLPEPEPPIEVPSIGLGVAAGLGGFAAAAGLTHLATRR